MNSPVDRRIPLPVLLALLLLVSVFALSQGAYNIGWHQLFSTHLSEADWQILLQVRLPRLIMALLVGAALAVSGTVMQALFRNPLADPGLLGIASGASVAVGLLIVLLPALDTSLIPLPFWAQSYLQSLAAFSGAVLTCLLIFRLAKRQGQVSVLHLLLAGIAINALAGAATGLLTYISDDQQLRALTFWAMGNLGGARWQQVAVMATLLMPSLAFLLWQSAKLNVLLLGEEEAGYLGIHVEQLKRKLVVLTALCVGITVAFAGLIGFVGLMVPHLVRLMLGADNRMVMPCATLLGASLLAAADTLARLLVIPAELPVGLVTSLLGGPFFLWLLFKSMRGES